MTLELRPLKADDAFAILNLIGKLDLIETIKDVLQGDRRDQIVNMAEGDDEEQATEVGLAIFTELAGAVVERVPQHKADIYTLLADVYQTDVATLKELNIHEFIELIVGFLKHEDFKRLLGSMEQYLG